MKFPSPIAVLICLLVSTGAHAQAPARHTPPESASSPAFFTEPEALDRIIRFGSRVGTTGATGDSTNGFYPEFGDMITGAGWLSAGPGYRHWYRHDRVFVDASTALSYRMYKAAQARVELPRLARSRVTVGLQGRWQDLPQIAYFGSGPESIEAHRSRYRLESSNIVGYVVGKPVQHVAIDARFGVVTHLSIREPGGTSDAGDPGAASRFPGDPVYQLAEQPGFVTTELGLLADTRDRRGYPSEGGVFRVAWSRYADRGSDRFSFQRYEAEVARYLPAASRRIVFVAHAWLAASGAEDSQAVPFYLQPALGGANTLRSYADYRFHDRNLLVVNGEVRLRLLKHVDWALFADAGSVAPTVRDLGLSRRSFGTGWRLHTVNATVARLDVAHGDEGWRVLFRVNDPFRLSRLGRRTAPLPFVP